MRVSIDKEELDKKLNIVRMNISTPALLEQFAEECSELSQASLKMARKLRNENPTPAKIEDIRENWLEEYFDVMLCALMLDINPIDSDVEFSQNETVYIDSKMLKKLSRWISRIEAKESIDEYCDILSYVENWR